MANSFAIVGAGRVGQTVGRALRRHGYRVVCVVTRSARSARAAARFIGAGRPLSSLKSGIAQIGEAGIVLIGTPDREIAAVARALARLEAGWRGKLVLHASGALSSRELIPLEEQGAVVGSFHPFYPFPRSLREFPRGVIFGVEGDRRAVRQAARLARALGGRPVEIAAEAKSLYHAGGVLADGHLMTLVDLGTRLLVRAGVPREHALPALLPLARGTLENYARRGAKSLTGPLKRGDAETIWHHLVALKSVPPHYRDAYLALARVGVDLYRRDRGRRTKELRQLLEM